MAEQTPIASMGFLELSKRTGDKGMIDIAEVLNASTPILEDIPWKECNWNLVSEKINRRASLPSGTFRQAYSGVTKSASTTQLVIEPTALLEDRSEIDEMIVDNSPNPTELRRTEDLAFIEGLGQSVCQAFIDGTTITTPERIDGLARRLHDTDQTTVINSGGGGGNTTSIYVVNWGFRTVYGIYPAAGGDRGRLGLSVINKGKEKVADADDTTASYYAYVTQFKWYIGLAVKNEDAIGRVANIELTKTGATGEFDEDDLITLLNIGKFAGSGTRIYMNQQLLTIAQIRLKDKTNVNWSVGEGLGGRPVMQFSGVPIRKIENTILTNGETEVTAST